MNQRRLLQALATNEQAAAGRAIRRITLLLQASAAAMRMAGQMSPAEYDSIRKSMSPPFVPEGFSGLWSVDHKYMLDLLRQLKPMLSTLGSDWDIDKRLWQEALDAAYQSHACVCEQFVAGGPSLAMRADRLPTKRSALESLEAFRVRAVGLLDVPTQNESS